MSAILLSIADRFFLALKILSKSKLSKLTPNSNSNTRVRERELEKVRPLGGPPRAGGGATTLFSCEFKSKSVIFYSESQNYLHLYILKTLWLQNYRIINYMNR